MAAWDTEVRLKKASWEDLDFLFQLRNDPEVRNNSFHNQPIPIEKHREWFDRKLKEESCKMFVLESVKEQLGQVRIENRIENLQSRNVWQISYSIIRGYRGKGYGEEMLRLLELKLGNNNMVLTGEVRQGNIQSQKVFRKLGYLEMKQEGGYVYRKQLPG